MTPTVAVVIGRFQPFHILHAHLLQQAASVADKVVVLIGGLDRPRTPKDPFTVQERSAVIVEWAKQSCEKIACITGIADYPYSDTAWTANVQSALDSILDSIDCKGANIRLVGCKKDSSSFYLNMFPQWTLHEVGYNQNVDATQIRELYFSGSDLAFVSGAVPPATLQFLSEFKQSADYQLMVDEKHTNDAYKKQWERAPYPPTFVTVDACVIQSGHVLVVRRKHSPGRGLYALPGGFLDQHERVIDGVIRELREETGLQVSSEVLKGSTKTVDVFDNPSRSLRGRTVSHVALIALPPGPLPEVCGTDDASWAGWIQLGLCKGHEFFEDHRDIIDYFTFRT